VIVAIDGPAGVGKSTVARALAERLGFRYLDTGAMYRALTWLALRDELPLEQGRELAELARRWPVEFDEQGRVTIAGIDVTAPIREPRIDRMVPVVARHPEVREVMRKRQRALGDAGDAVIEGRDIGAVVAPHAEVKVYLDANPRERARRRASERPGVGAEALGTDLASRDRRDAVNTHVAAGAVVIDTDAISVADVVARIEALVVECRA
jgi:CMP/dCMP kinase